MTANRAAVLALTLMSAATSNGSIELKIAVISSGAATLDQGSVVNVGQPMVGLAVSQDKSFASDAGLIPCMFASGPCYSDFDGNGSLDLFDFLAYVNLFNAGDESADCTGDDVLDLFDFLCFVNAFNQGC